MRNRSRRCTAGKQRLHFFLLAAVCGFAGSANSGRIGRLAGFFEDRGEQGAGLIVGTQIERLAQGRRGGIEFAGAKRAQRQIESEVGFRRHALARLHPQAARFGPLALAGERIKGNPGSLFGGLLTVAQVGGMIVPASIGFIADETSVRLGLGLLVGTYGAIVLIVRRLAAPGEAG